MRVLGLRRPWRAKAAGSTAVSGGGDADQKAPAHALKQHIIVQAGHFATSETGAEHVLRWLRELATQPQ